MELELKLLTPSVFFRNTHFQLKKLIEDWLQDFLDFKLLVQCDDSLCFLFDSFLKFSWRQVLRAPCLSTAVGTAWLTGENNKFLKIFPGLDLRVANSLRRNLRNYPETTRLTQKYRSNWITFKIQRALWIFH